MARLFGWFRRRETLWYVSVHEEQYPERFDERPTYKALYSYQRSQIEARVLGERYMAEEMPGGALRVVEVEPRSDGLSWRPVR